MIAFLSAVRWDVTLQARNGFYWASVFLVIVVGTLSGRSSFLRPFSFSPGCSPGTGRCARCGQRHRARALCAMWPSAPSFAEWPSPSQHGSLIGSCCDRVDAAGGPLRPLSAAP